MDDQNKEKRASPRRRVLKGAIIVSNDRSSTLSCTVRNLSAAGAQVRVEGSVPQRFILRIEVDGIEVDCEIANRRGKDIGVKFVSETRTVKANRVQIVGPLK